MQHPAKSLPGPVHQIVGRYTPENETRARSVSPHVICSYRSKVIQADDLLGRRFGPGDSKAEDRD